MFSHAYVLGESETISKGLDNVFGVAAHEGSTVTELGLATFTWLDYVAEVCPHARDVGSITQVRHRGIEVSRLIDGRMESESRIFFALQPAEAAIGG